MATTRTDEQTTLGVVVEIANGDKVTYKTRSFKYIAPATTDDDVRTWGNQLGAFQTHDVSGVKRTDVAILEE